MKFCWPGILICIVSLIKLDSFAQYSNSGIENGLGKVPVESDSIYCKTGYLKLSLPDGMGHSTNYEEGFIFKGRKVGIWCKRNFQHRIISLTVFYDTTSERMGFFEYYVSNGMLKECGDYLMTKVPISDSLSIVLPNENHINYFVLEGEYKKTGIWTYFHENGNISSRGQYNLGEKTGVWKFYNLAGEFVENKTY